jgi:hypothetical protein
MTITGSVMDEAGSAVENAQVLIQSLTLATTTGEDGTYQLFVPAARMAGQTSAADPFLLEAVIVTGQGMRESRAKLATQISSIRAEDITESKAETNLIAAMTGKAPNVEVSTSAGDPGSGG